MGSRDVVWLAGMNPSFLLGAPTGCCYEVSLGLLAAAWGSALPVFQAPAADRAWEELDFSRALKKGGAGGGWAELRRRHRAWARLPRSLPFAASGNGAGGVCHLSLSVLTLKAEFHLVVFMRIPLNKAASRYVYTR